MIEAKNLSFSYPNSKEILKEISFLQKGGHCLALLGNNGAGKSTLLSCLNGTLHASGDIQVLGKNLRNMKRNEIAQSMAFVAQKTDISQLTVYDSVLLGRMPYFKINPSEDDYAVVDEVIKQMELEKLSLCYIDELSGGELQKTALARALAQKPRILLLDEPTSNLDIYNQHEVMRIATETAARDGILVIAVLHDLNLALRYCDRFMFLKDAQIYAYGKSGIVTEKAIRDVYNVSAEIIELHGHKVVVV